MAWHCILHWRNKRKTYTKLWTPQSHPIASPLGQAMVCLWTVNQWNQECYLDLMLWWDWSVSCCVTVTMRKTPYVGRIPHSLIMAAQVPGSCSTSYGHQRAWVTVIPSHGHQENVHVLINNIFVDDGRLIQTWWISLVIRRKSST